MNKRKSLFCFLTFLLVLSYCLPSLAEDGGTLRFEPLKLESEPVLWGLQGVGNNSPRSAVMKLDGDESEPVWVWEMEPVSFVIPKTGTPRLFVDLNGDGKYEPLEIREPSSNNRYRREYIIAGVLIQLGDFQQIVRVDITNLGELPGWLHVEKCHSCYVGNLNVEGERCPAQLEIRTPYPATGSAQATIILDTNRDGTFDPYVDAWLADRGVGYWKGQLKQVETVYSKGKAQISIKEYTGPVATLKIEGEGFCRLHLQRQLDGNKAEGAIVQTYWFCVPEQENAVYPMPPGRYTVDSGWLVPPVEGMEGIAFELNAQLSQSQLAHQLRLIEGQTLTANYGGPLEHGIRAIPSSFRGRVDLDYAGLNNGSDIVYLQTILPSTKGRGENSAPTYEVRSSSGKVVDVGKFAYG